VYIVAFTNVLTVRKNTTQRKLTRKLTSKGRVEWQVRDTAERRKDKREGVQARHGLL
jgi:hypothetical protein